MEIWLLTELGGGRLKQKYLLIFLLISITITTATAQEIMVSDGGLLGIEGEYTTNLTETYYGSTLFIQVSNVTTQEYAILVNGKSIGSNNATYTVTEESGNITISTSPETTSLEIAVKKQDGFGYYIAKYLVIAKSLPAISGIILVDTLIWAVFAIPIGTAIALRIVIEIVRAIL